VSSESAGGFEAGEANSGDTSPDSSAGLISGQSQYSGDSSTGKSGAQTADEPLTYEIIFRADAAFVEKLRRLQALLSTDPNPPLAPIFNRAIELALDRYDPERRQVRRELRRTRNAAQMSESAVTQDPGYSAFDGAEVDSEKAGEVIRDQRSSYRNIVGNNDESKGQVTRRINDEQNGHNTERKNEENIGRRREALSHRSDDQNSAGNNGQNNAQINAQINARINARINAQINARKEDAIHGMKGGTSSVPYRETLPRRGGMTKRPKIPQRVRDQVLIRDGHRCTYIGTDGRCPAGTELEIDHICPHAQGGSDHIDNLRTLCRAHNQRAAEVVFGVEFVRRRRGESRSSLEMNPFIERAVGSAELEAMAQMESVPL
jgi:5-methylcytosine-specific restriction endonuclease McrA